MLAWVWDLELGEKARLSRGIFLYCTDSFVNRESDIHMKLSGTSLYFRILHKCLLTLYSMESINIYLVNCLSVGAGERATMLRALSRFVSQHPHGSSQPPVSPLSRDLGLTPSLWCHGASPWALDFAYCIYRCTQAKHS